MANYKIWFDGSCWPNPGGKAAYGAVVEQSGVLGSMCELADVIETSKFMSNNVAEFWSLAEGFQWFIENAYPDSSDSVDVYGDSDLVIKMMTGIWKPNSSKLYYKAYCRASSLAQTLKDKFGVTIRFHWIPRAQNDRCDKLSKKYQK